MANHSCYSSQCMGAHILIILFDENHKYCNYSQFDVCIVAHMDCYVIVVHDIVTKIWLLIGLDKNGIKIMCRPTVLIYCPGAHNGPMYFISAMLHGNEIIKKSSITIIIPLDLFHNSIILLKRAEAFIASISYLNTMCDIHKNDIC